MAKKPCLADMLGDDDDHGSAQFKGAKKTRPKDSPAIKKSGVDKTSGKSNRLGFGGRSAQLTRDLTKKGLPESEVGAIVGKEARRTGTAPGQAGFHGGKKGN